MEQQKLILDYDRDVLEQKIHFAQERVKPEPRHSTRDRDAQGHMRLPEGRAKTGGPGARRTQTG